MRPAGEATRERILAAAKEEFAEHGLAGARINRIAASALVSNDPETSESPVSRAAARAFAEAGITPVDTDVVEVHDAAAPAELFCVEELGLCAERAQLVDERFVIPAAKLAITTV